MRKRRLLLPDAVYHVTMRANRKDMILDSAGAKELYLNVLKAARRRFTFQVHNFCIMGNHVHLIVEPRNGESLSRIMQWINSVFAIRYNRVMGSCGHVWGERFFSAILHHISDYLRTFLYIDENPSAAHLAGSPAAWAYCGLRHSREGRYDVINPPGLLQQLLYPDRLPVLLPKTSASDTCLCSC